MAKCKGGRGWRPCGAEVLYVRSSFCDGNVGLDVEPSDRGDVVLRSGLAYVLTREEVAAHKGPRFTMHLTTCRNATAAMGMPLWRGGAKQSTQLRPAFEMGTFETPSAAALAAIEVGALDQEADRMAEKFIEHLVAVRGEREIYEYSEIHETFNAFRRLFGVRREICEAMKPRIRRRVYVAEPEAA